MAESPRNVERLPFLKLNPRQQCDVEMLMNGAFSPLDGFLGRDDHLAVLQQGCLADGTLWPVPVMLDIDPAMASAIGDADQVLLLDAELYPVAVLDIREIWQPDRKREINVLYGCDDVYHDGVREMLLGTATRYVSGRLRGLRMPACHFQKAYRTTAHDQRAALQQAGHSEVLGWIACEPPDVACMQWLRGALTACEADHLITFHGVEIAPRNTPPARTTARCLDAVLPRFTEVLTASYCSLPMWPRWSGMRDIILHAILCQNFGAGQFLFGESGAVAPISRGRRPPARRLDRELFDKAQRELQIRFHMPSDAERSLPFERKPAKVATANVGEGTLPEVEAIVHHKTPGRRHDGLAILITGLSGAGKSTLAHRLADRMEAEFDRYVTLLDGDYSRLLLTSDLAVSEEDQIKNVQRHAYVAAQIVRHGGLAILALVAPSNAVRAEARRVVEQYGHFVEIYLSASAEECKQRDVKGIYARIQRGELGKAVSVAASYQAPESSEIAVNSCAYDIDAVTRLVFDQLIAMRYLSAIS